MRTLLKLAVIGFLCWYFLNHTPPKSQRVKYPPTSQKEASGWDMERIEDAPMEYLDQAVERCKAIRKAFRAREIAIRARKRDVLRQQDDLTVLEIAYHRLQTELQLLLKADRSWPAEVRGLLLSKVEAEDRLIDTAARLRDIPPRLARYQRLGVLLDKELAALRRREEDARQVQVRLDACQDIAEGRALLVRLDSLQSELEQLEDTAEGLLALEDAVTTDSLAETHTVSRERDLGNLLQEGR